jgi:hypothetical protein
MTLYYFSSIFELSAFICDEHLLIHVRRGSSLQICIEKELHLRYGNGYQKKENIPS